MKTYSAILRFATYYSAEFTDEDMVADGYDNPKEYAQDLDIDELEKAFEPSDDELELVNLVFDEDTEDEKTETAFKKMSVALDLESGRHGSFAANIGSAWISADQNNRQKLEMAFSEIFQKGSF